MDKNVIKFDDNEIGEGKFHHYKSLILINFLYIYINEIVICKKFPFSKQDFKYFTGYTDHKKLDLYVHYFQNVKDVLIKLNIHFMIEEKVFDKLWKFWKKLAT